MPQVYGKKSGPICKIDSVISLIYGVQGNPNRRTRCQVWRVNNIKDLMELKRTDDVTCLMTKAQRTIPFLLVISLQ